LRKYLISFFSRNLILFQGFWTEGIYRKAAVQPGLQAAGQHTHLFYPTPFQQLCHPGAGSLVRSGAVQNNLPVPGNPLHLAADARQRQVKSPREVLRF
jgi:hypothetical protein